MNEIFQKKWLKWVQSTENWWQIVNNLPQNCRKFLTRYKSEIPMNMCSKKQQRMNSKFSKMFQKNG